LSSRYPLADLEEALAEGIVNGRQAAETPQFQLYAGPIEGLIAHLASIRAKRLRAGDKSARPRRLRGIEGNAIVIADGPADADRFAARRHRIDRASIEMDRACRVVARSVGRAQLALLGKRRRQAATEPYTPYTRLNI
jgi:hypothetical protein